MFNAIKNVHSIAKAALAEIVSDFRDVVKENAESTFATI